MSNRIPSIAAIGVIGRANNPLHISLFPATERDPLQFQLLLSSCLDIFEVRSGQRTVEQDFGLLHALDERLAAYGWLTNTGVKFVVVVDMEGRAAGRAGKPHESMAVRDADLRPVFRALGAAYVALLRNPFYAPDEGGKAGRGAGRIESRRFEAEVRRIAEAWVPGGGGL